MSGIRRNTLLLFLLFSVLLSSCGGGTVVPTSTPAPTATLAATATATNTPIPIPPLQGLAYSPYRDCQSPSTKLQPSLADIQQDLEIIASMGNAVRTYSSTGINAEIPRLARQMGLRVSAGAWLGKDKAINELEIEGLIKLAQSVELESVIVGNEVLLRGDLSESELIAYINRVKSQVSVPVTTAEIGAILLGHPAVMNAVDFQMVHLYSFWDGMPIESGASAVVEAYKDIQSRVGGKRVVIGETGWPSGGPVNNQAVPSPENQRRFAQEFLTLAQQNQVEFFYFDAFDEMWKTEGGVGPYWGLLDANRQYKYDIKGVFEAFDITIESDGAQVGALATAAPTLAPGMENGPASYWVYGNFNSENIHYAPSGWMGAYNQIELNTCYIQEQVAWGDTAIRVSYLPSPEDNVSLPWAGIYWLEPEDNWGVLPCDHCNLSQYQQLIFRARAETNDTQVKFFVGGVSQTDSPNPVPLPLGSSIKSPVFAQGADASDGFISLTDTWQEYHIDLRNVDRSYIIDGFGWAAEKSRSPEGVVFYLDDIRFSTEPPPPAPIPPFHIYTGSILRPGLDMGLASSGNLTGWVEDLDGAMRIRYDAWQDWAVVFITVGSHKTRSGSRASVDLSAYKTLSLEMKGEQGGEVVYIGIKHRNQPDNGRETKIPITLTGSWQTYQIDLGQFTGWKNLLAGIYIPIEFVFEPTINQDEIIYFRNVQYLP